MSPQDELRKLQLQRLLLSERDELAETLFAVVQLALKEHGVFIDRSTSTGEDLMEVMEKLAHPK